MSPVLSVLTATKYFGEWQTTCYTVMYSTITCSIVGVLVGYTWRIKSLQLICVFLGVLVINRSAMAPLGKVFGMLCYMLGLLLPTLNSDDEAYSSIHVCLHLILFTNVPIFITGVSLLLPYPVVSLTECQEKVVTLCHKLSMILDNHVDAFLLPDQAALHVSLADTRTADARELLQSLAQLQENIRKESLFFPPLRSFHLLLCELLPLLSEVHDNLRDLKEIGGDIAPNRTQEMFVKLLQAPLRRFEDGVREMLQEVVVGQVGQTDRQTMTHYNMT